MGTDRGQDLHSFANGTSLPRNTIPRQLELAGHVTGTLPLLLLVCLLLCSSDEITRCHLKFWFYLTGTVAKLLKFWLTLLKTIQLKVKDEWQHLHRTPQIFLTLR